MDLFTAILKAAVDAGASDIHIRAGKPVTFRVQGQLITAEGPTPSAEWTERICQEILPPHLKKEYENRHELDFSYDLPEVGRFRIAAFLQRGLRSLVLRTVKTRIPKFDDLGLPNQILDLAEAPHGILIVTGATGAGKSTTLAALIDHINGLRACRIITIEDPVEYLFQDRLATIDQREVGIDTETFDGAVRAVLRQDPDVIMIGELRDAASLSCALRAADTGHFVLTTLHATTAAQSLHRILDLLPDSAHPQTLRHLSTTLRGVVCQRMLNLKSGKVRPAAEVLVNTPAVKKLLHDNILNKLDDAIESGASDGMLGFNRSILDMVNRGDITLEEGLDKASNPQALRMNIQGITVREGTRILG